ncbi:MAG: sporulation peptidase YabG [Firmicutes bacterium]|nr:sporulation peptidase YabG [Bacillota bacterium]
MLQRGSLVRRRSYGEDMLFWVEYVGADGVVLLNGVNYRVTADAYLWDLVELSENETRGIRRREAALIQEKVEELKRRHIRAGMGSKESFPKSVRILHMDGDGEYLKICMKYYQELGLEAYGEAVEERRQPVEVLRLLKQYHPEILVVTGHDSLPKDQGDILKEDSYKSSRFFGETVRRARTYEPDMDRLVIIAGACQSYYELLMEAGANFASSPGRVLIHAMDPVILCAEIVYTPLRERIRVEEAVGMTFSGAAGMGGYDTLGKGRRGYPAGRRKIGSYPV